MPILLFVSLCIRQQLDLLASMTSCCTVFLLLADDPYAFLRSKGIFVKLFSKPRELVCVALSSLVLSFLSFCPSPFSGTTTTTTTTMDGRTTKSKYDYFHFSIITRNLFLQAKFGEIKRES
jgi:hypothetical protein